MNQLKNKSKQIVGLLIVIINTLWTVHWSLLLLAYHFTSILWLYMLPDWLLILNILIGLWGGYIGYRLIKSKISILIALTMDIFILIMGLIVLYSVMW